MGSRLLEAAVDRGAYPERLPGNAALDTAPGPPRTPGAGDRLSVAWQGPQPSSLESLIRGILTQDKAQSMKRSPQGALNMGPRTDPLPISQCKATGKVAWRQDEPDTWGPVQAVN